MTSRAPLLLGLALPALGSAVAAQCPIESPIESLLDDSVSRDEELGLAVAFDGDVVMVGSGDQSQFSTNGAVSVFERGSSGFALTQKLFSGVDYATNFGQSVDVEGDLALVGAPGSNFQPGYAFVFERRPIGWVRTAVLAPNDGVKDWDFGLDVAVSGDTLVVGSPAEHGKVLSSGAAYVFERTGRGWEQSAKLFPAEAVVSEGFGIAIGFEGDLLLIGAELAVGAALDTGAVYQFERAGTGWIQTDKLFAAQGGPFWRFGNALAFDADTLLVGADGANNSTGVAFVLERAGTTWNETAQLSGSTTFSGSLFGDSVALSGDRAVVGAPSFASPGAAYLFERTGTVWTETAQLFAPLVEPSDRFGAGVAVQDDGAVVGAPGDLTGAAYTFATSHEFDTLLPAAGPGGAPTSTISLAAGGEQGLQLNGCLSLAGQLYWLLGSATGEDGVPFGAFALPLTLDAYFLATLTSPNAAPLVASFGTLDSQAKATAGFALPAGLDGALAGVKLRHAFGVLDLETLEPLFASNVVSVTLAP